jgi:urease accessory protein
MGPESRAIVADALAVGRLARGERWVFREIESRIAVTAEGRPLFVDRLRLDPARATFQGLGGMEGFGYLGTLGLFARGFGPWEDLARALEERLGEWPAVRGGATALPRDGCLVRFLAPSAYDLTEAARGLWTLARRLLLGLPPVDLRKW